MADNSNSNHHRLQSFNTGTASNSHRKHNHVRGGNNSFFAGAEDKDYEDDLNGEGEGDAEVWNALTKSFDQVQWVLDRNLVLIHQVNEDHQSKIHDNLVKNVALIQEINGNISKVVSLYSDLSTNFSTIVNEHNAHAGVHNADKDNSAKPNNLHA